MRPSKSEHSSDVPRVAVISSRDTQMSNQICQRAHSILHPMRSFEISRIPIHSQLSNLSVCNALVRGNELKFLNIGLRIVLPAQYLRRPSSFKGTKNAIGNFCAPY